MRKNYFSIGEMAKISGIARKTLIYYDKEDLFKPVFVDDNGYRYYDLQQLDTMEIIKMFREFEVPIKTIKEYLKNRNKDAFISMMEKVELVMEQRMHKTLNYLEVVRWKQNTVKSGLEIKDVDLIVVKHKEMISLYGISVDENEAEHENFSGVLSQLEREMKRNDIIGHSVYAQVNQTLLKPDYDGRISRFSMGLTESGVQHQNGIMPKGKYVSAYHIGPYEDTSKTYKRMFKYIDDNDLVIDGDSFEVDFFNFFTENTQQDYMMEICIKVK